MEWFILVIAGTLYAVTAYLSYHEELRESAWWMPISCFIGTVLVVIWFGVVKLISDRDRLYFYSMCWDTIIVFVYYFMPILWFGVKMDKLAMLGVFLMVAGLVCLKVRL